MDLPYIFSGFLVGMLVGVTGVGGGSLMTPLLVFLFGFQPAVAVGTDLLFAAITKTSGVWVHHGKHGSVNWKVVGLLSVGSLPLAVATIFVIRHLISIGQQTSGLITYALGIALILTACALLVRSYLLRNSERVVDGGDIAAGRFDKLQVPATILVGAVSGCGAIPVSPSQVFW